VKGERARRGLQCLLAEPRGVGERILDKSLAMTRLTIAEAPAQEFSVNGRNSITETEDEGLIFYGDVTKVQVSPDEQRLPCRSLPLISKSRWIFRMPALFVKHWAYSRLSVSIDYLISAGLFL
jgi:hypothetical protein